MSSLPELDSEDVSSSLPTTRVDRLLRERIRRNRSHQAFDICEDVPQEDPVLESVPEPPAQARLVVVANRLPVTCSKDSSGRWQLQASAGGLVSALKGVSNYVTLWIGWPGIWVKQGRERDELTAILKAEGFSPVWMDHTLLDLYYNGFCNSVLWQLFHYVPLNIDTWQKMAEHRAMQLQWQAYQMANEKFADVVLAEYATNDVVWVQDYHLMLLPSLLKQNVPKMKVGFFLHTPFPSSEMYRTLPVREEVLRAVLAADLVGFHTYDYARHFISSCTRILGLEGTPEGVENNGVLTRVGTFPIGIDPERFTRALESGEVQSQTAKLLNRYAGRKIMLGVDRLDMVKGIPQKLLAYEKFLEEHPEWRDKVLLVQIAVPSRTDVPEYQKLRSMVHEIVGRINGQYGTLTYVPIYHLDTSLSFTELCALYAVTDVALVTSLRDGMNLVSYEYVACQSDNAGVLVLSEFAGAAQSLGAGALLVNPWNISDMANAIYDALSMNEEERRERHRQNYMHVQTHTAQHWADTFITELNDTHIEADLRMRHTPPPLDVQEVVRAYQCSKRRLVVLGYNATLTTSVEAPRLPKRQFEQVKALAKVNPRVMQSVCELCTDPANVVVIFSGSETSKLDEVFGHLPVWLAAENGVYVRPPAGGAGGAAGGAAGRPGGDGPGARSQSPAPLPQWKCVFDQVHCEWMESVQLVFDYFCERTPRSFVEARETSLVWNYKYADVEFGRIQARDLLQHLWTGPISNAPVEIIQGGKSVEVRPVGVTKGLAMQRLVGLIAAEGGIEAAAFDMVLCIGHLLGRDENLFSLFEGARIDGAAPAHNSRSERFAAANAAALAAATANGGAGQTPQEMLYTAAAARAGSRAAAAAAAAAAGAAAAAAAHGSRHARSSSTGGIHVSVEDPPTGRLGSGGGAGPSGSGSGPLGTGPPALPALAAMQQQNHHHHHQQTAQQQPGGGGGRALSGLGPSSLTQAIGAARGHTTIVPPATATPTPSQTSASSPFLAQSATPLPHSNSPRDPTQVPMAAAGSPTTSMAAASAQCSSPHATAPAPEAATAVGGRPTEPAHSHPMARPQPQQQQPHPQTQQQGQQQQMQLLQHLAAAQMHGAGVGPHHPHLHPYPGLGLGAGAGHHHHHHGGAMPPHTERLGRSGSGGGAAMGGGGGSGLPGAGGSMPDGLQRRLAGGVASGPGGSTSSGHPHPHPHPQPQPHPHPHRPHQTHSMDEVQMKARALAAAAAAVAAVGNSSVADRLAGIFPPKYLYTCTVGRNRSKARYALATSAEVGDLLDAIVQQGIYHRPRAATCAASAPADLGLSGLSLSGGRRDSTSSADALSPDSMLGELLGAQAAGLQGEGMRGLRDVDRLSAMSLPLEESSSLAHSANTGVLGGGGGGGGAAAAAAAAAAPGAAAGGSGSGAAAAGIGGIGGTAPPHLASLGHHPHSQLFPFLNHHGHHQGHHHSQQHHPLPQQQQPQPPSQQPSQLPPHQSLQVQTTGSWADLEHRLTASSLGAGSQLAAALGGASGVAAGGGGGAGSGSSGGASGSLDHPFSASPSHQQSLPTLFGPGPAAAAAPVQGQGPEGEAMATALLPPWQLLDGPVGDAAEAPGAAAAAGGGTVGREGQAE